MRAFLGRVGLATWKTGRRYIAWERRHMPAFGIGITSAALLYLTVANMWPTMAPRWVAGVVGVYGISAAVSAMVETVREARRCLRAEPVAELITALTMPVAGFAVWVLLFHTMPGAFLPAVSWLLDHEAVIVHVAMPACVIVGIIAAFTAEMRAKGATWRGLVDTIRDMRTERREGRHEREI